MIVRTIEIALSSAIVLFAVVIPLAVVMVDLSPADATVPALAAAVEWVAPAVLPD